MKFFKENSYIFVSTLLVLILFGIIINGTYAGYQQYKLGGEPKMYGLMYVSPEGEKEYYTNTEMGSVSNDITRIAELAQFKTAEAKAKQLLKAGHLEEAGGEIYVIEIVKFAVNPVLVTIPKKKDGYIIESKNENDLSTCYYQGPMNRRYYSRYDFSDCLTPATVFKTEQKALEMIMRLINEIRSNEETELSNHKRYHPERVYSNHFPTIVERNDFIIESFKAVKTNESN